MKLLSENYFYGTIAAAATASATTGFLFGLTSTIWNPSARYGDLTAALLAPLLNAFFGFLFGALPAFVLLAVPLAFVRDRSFAWRIVACVAAALVIDALGFLQLEIIFPPMAGFGLETEAVQNLSRYPVSSAWKLAAPILAAVLAGYAFHLCQDHPSRSRKALLPPVA